MLGAKEDDQMVTASPFVAETVAAAGLQAEDTSWGRYPFSLLGRTKDKVPKVRRASL